MSKGFDFVAVAALVATLEEEKESFEQAAEAHKASAAFVEERRKRVSELQMRINAALDKLKETPVWGTPWHEERTRKNELGERQQAIGLAQKMGMPAQHLQQYLQSAAAQNKAGQYSAAQNAASQNAQSMIPPPWKGLMK